MENWSTRGGRLHWAMRQQEPDGRRSGMRLFRERINKRSEELADAEEERLVGTSLTSLKDYVADRAEPNLRFLEEAAKLLGVRSAWLICNHGPPTEAFDALPEDTPIVSGGRRDVELKLANAVLQAIGLPEFKRRSRDAPSATEEGAEIAAETPGFEQVPYWVGSLLQVRLRLRYTDILLDPAAEIAAARTGDHTAEEDVAEGISSALAGPLLEWDVDPTRMGEETLGDYILSMVPALILLAHERNRQRLEDVEKTRRK